MDNTSSNKINRSPSFLHLKWTQTHENDSKMASQGQPHGITTETSNSLNSEHKSTNHFVLRDTLITKPLFSDNGTSTNVFEHNIVTVDSDIKVQSLNKTNICIHNISDICSHINANTSNNVSNTNNDNIPKPPFRDTVINLSSQPLTPAQISLLSKGLNFCPTPGKPDMGQIRSDLEKFHTGILCKSFFSKEDNLNLSSQQNWSQNSTLNMLNTTSKAGNVGEPFQHRKFRNPSTFKPPGPPNLEAFIAVNEINLSYCQTRAPHKQNLSIAEKQALKELQNNKQIVIKAADKGSGVVVMDREDYINEGLRQLNDTKFYEKVKENPTLTFNQEIEIELNSMLNKGEIDKKCKDYLFIKEPRTAQFYLLPKIHKGILPPPGRPIVSANECPTERISEFVDFFLRPYVTEIKSYIRDTTHFIDIINKIGKIPPQTKLVTLDVTSLYTNIPSWEGIIAVGNTFARKRTKGTYPSNTSLINLLKLVLYKNNFEFNGEQYVQRAGTSMGTRLAPSLVMRR